MPKERAISKEAARLIALAKVNDALADGSSLRASLQRVLQLLDRRDNIVCSSVTLLNPDSGLLQVEAAEGLTPEGRSARYSSQSRHHPAVRHRGGSRYDLFIRSGHKNRGLRQPHSRVRGRGVGGRAAGRDDIFRPPT